ncbi:hypothetical protein ACIGDI_34390 [Streptomyces sp. NPDC085900]|uniref:hypothetical protein n=1 Tax=Streptomyces sp. NPDC085900 TaxID=3365737 RepID=UPI0037CE3F53
MGSQLDWPADAASRPPRQVSQLRVPVKWLCTACTFIAPTGLRLPRTPERAFAHLLHCPARRPLAVTD